MPDVQKAVEELFDRIENVIVAPVSSIVDFDKKECLKYVGEEATVKIVIGSNGRSGGRIVYTEPAPEITDELIRRLKLFIEEADRIFDENPDEYGREYDVPLTLPNGGVISVVSRRLDYSFVIYAMPVMVTAKFELALRDDVGMHRLTITTQYPTANPTAITSRITMFTAVSSEAIKVYNKFLKTVQPVLDNFSIDVVEIITNNKLKLPEKQMKEIKAVMENAGTQRDPTFI